MHLPSTYSDFAPHLGSRWRRLGSQADFRGKLTPTNSKDRFGPPLAVRGAFNARRELGVEPTKQDKTSTYRRKLTVAAGASRQPGVAEAVEKVRAARFRATIVPLGRVGNHFDSTSPRALNHCFKNSGSGDFFNSLGYERLFRPSCRCDRFTPNSRQSNRHVRPLIVFVCFSVMSGPMAGRPVSDI